MNKKEIGKFGEEIAQNYLFSQNYQIIKTNFHSKYGEIDIIAADYSNNQLAFIEVKTRASLTFGPPLSALTHTKKSKIIKTALTFLIVSTQNLPKHWRIDVIGIQLDQAHQLKTLKHVKNI